MVLNELKEIKNYKRFFKLFSGFKLTLYPFIEKVKLLKEYTQQSQKLSNGETKTYSA